MKPVILLGCILLSGCSLFQTANKQQNRQQLERITTETQHAQRQRMVHQRGALASRQRDSSVFELTVRALGNYHIHPDSGITGNNAEFVLRGMWKSDSQRLGVRLSADTATEADSLDRMERAVAVTWHSEANRVRLRWNPWWLLLGLALVVGHYSMKRRGL